MVEGMVSSQCLPPLLWKDGGKVTSLGWRLWSERYGVLSTLTHQHLTPTTISHLSMKESIEERSHRIEYQLIPFYVNPFQTRFKSYQWRNRKKLIAVYEIGERTQRNNCRGHRQGKQSLSTIFVREIANKRSHNKSSQSCDLQEMGWRKSIRCFDHRSQKHHTAVKTHCMILISTGGWRPKSCFTLWWVLYCQA